MTYPLSRPVSAIDSKCSPPKRYRWGTVHAFRKLSACQLQVAGESATEVAVLVCGAEFLDHLGSAGIQSLLDSRVIYGIKFGGIAADHGGQELTLLALDSGAVVCLGLDGHGETDLGPGIDQGIGVGGYASFMPR